MRKIVFMLILIFLIVSGCVFRSSTQERSTQFSLGLRPLPREFLDWWFENLDTLKNNKKIVEYYSDIAQTQELILSPLIDVSRIDPYDMRALGLVTPPKDQGSNDTCWAFATIGSLESAMLTQLGVSEISSRYPFIPFPNEPNLSEQFVAYHNKDWEVRPDPYTDGGWVLTYHETNKDLGGSAFFSMYDLIQRGAPIEEVFPYITTDYDWIRWNSTNPSWEHDRVRADKTLVIPPYDYQDFQNQDWEYYVNTIKSVLKLFGALYVGMMVYSDFYNYWNNWPNDGEVYLKSEYSSLVGGHAILLVGWDNEYHDSHSSYTGPVWILKNSWGTDGGDGGYFYLPMITPDEFQKKQCPDWKIEYQYMYVPYFESE